MSAASSAAKSATALRAARRQDDRIDDESSSGDESTKRADELFSASRKRKRLVRRSAKESNARKKSARRLSFAARAANNERSDDEASESKDDDKQQDDSRSTTPPPPPPRRSSLGGSRLTPRPPPLPSNAPPRRSTPLPSPPPEQPQLPPPPPLNPQANPRAPTNHSLIWPVPQKRRLTPVECRVAGVAKRRAVLPPASAGRCAEIDGIFPRQLPDAPQDERRWDCDYFCLLLAVEVVASLSMVDLASVPLKDKAVHSFSDVDDLAQNDARVMFDRLQWTRIVDAPLDLLVQKRHRAAVLRAFHRHHVPIAPNSNELVLSAKKKTPVWARSV